MAVNLKKHLPNAQFGKGNHKPIDWTKHHEEDPDDEELPHTPKDVTRMLGFDPKTKSKSKTPPVKKGSK